MSVNDSNMFTPVGIKKSNDKLVILDTNSSTDNLSFHSSTNTNNVDTLSIKTLLNKDVNKDLNLSSYDGSSINPIIQINNTHQHVNITSNLNVASNLNVPTIYYKDVNKDLNLSAYDGSSINPIIQINNTHQHVNITSNLNVASNIILSGNISASADADTDHTLGRAKIGGMGHNDHAGFSHYDHAIQTNYALLQSSTGYTILNGKDNVYIKVNNATKVNISSTAMNCHGNTDGVFTFGRARLGYIGYIDEAAFAHEDHATEDYYALLQGSSGHTILNGKNNVYIKINNVPKIHVNSNNLVCHENTDTSFIFGRARIWTMGHDDNAGFSHYDYGTTSNYALLQSLYGDTYLNAPVGRTVYLAIGNIPRGWINKDHANDRPINLNFTGQHRCVPNNINYYNNIDNYIGLIVYATGNYKTYDSENDILHADNKAITINDSLPIVELVNKKKDKAVFGIISDKEEEERVYVAGCLKTPISNKYDDKRLYINSLGEGAIWIVNTNGNLENGDYIQSSDVIGHGEKQDDDFLHNYTVAKITCDCTFDINSSDYNCNEFIDATSGNTYRKAFVGCTYHCG